MSRPKNKEIAEKWRDWNGKEVLLLKTMLAYHVTSLHLAESFMMSQLKAVFADPLRVVWNPGAESENAVYDLRCEEKPYFVVSIKAKGFPAYRMISSFYATPADRLPPATWRVLWERKR